MNVYDIARVSQTLAKRVRVFRTQTGNTEDLYIGYN
jgi:hypothetical protein